MFSVTATVPQDWQVISNGVRETAGLPDPGAGHSVFRWSIKEPIASYLTTIYIDKFTVVTDALADGTPIVSALGPEALRRQATRRGHQAGDRGAVRLFRAVPI